jgi:hypothetical protein
MGQIMHGSARTTEAVRRAIQDSQASIAVLAERYGINCQVPDDYKVYDETTQGAWHAIVASHGWVALH